MDKTALDTLLTLPKPHFDPDLPLDRIDLNPYQPRDPIGEEDIEGMKAHIRSGILEPIIVHRKGERFELIAGERRLRAAKSLGMTAIPAMVYPELAPGQVKMMSLQENLGRKDLDWLEIARGYQALADEGLTHEQIAGLMGVGKSTVTHRLRLLNLPEEIKKVPRGTFSEGHAKVLLQLETPEEQIEAFREWQKSPVTRKSFQKIVKRAKSGISVGEMPSEKTITAKKESGVVGPWPSKPAEGGRSRQWKITKNFLLLFSRNPENGRWRLTLEARPRVIIQTALTFVGVLALIFAANLLSNDSMTDDKRTPAFSPETPPRKSPKGAFFGEAQKELSSLPDPAKDPTGLSSGGG